MKSIHSSRMLAMAWLLLTWSGLSVSSAPIPSDWDQLKIPQPKGYVCYQARAPLQVDGKLNEPAWQSAPWTDEFADIEGNLKPKPRFRTRAKMLWDDTYFYIAAELEEPHVSGTLTKHDSVIFQDNDFEIFIDPNGDNHEYYEIEINALNTVWDLFLKTPYKDGGSALDDWEIPGLKSAIHIEGTLNDPNDSDKGWTVEMAFPWKVLGEFAHRPAPPQHGDQWRVNFSRVEWLYEVVEGKYRKVPNRKEDNWVWSPQGIIDMHRPEKWGYVQFSTAKVGETQFVSDSSLPIRDFLHQLYYAQRVYRKLNQRWAPDLKVLDLSLDPRSLRAPFTIELSGTNFLATGEAVLPSGRTDRWHIQNNSRIWKE